jgi:hypothetical protein
LNTLVSPGGCRGGEVCDSQPSVSVVNVKTQQIVFGFQGSVYVKMGASPSEYDSLYFGQDCNTTSCGQKVTTTLASATFVDGIATFQANYIVVI